MCRLFQSWECRMSVLLLFFFFNDTATTEIYTLSLHDALPISRRGRLRRKRGPCARQALSLAPARATYKDRKSTRLNSSHSQISYAVFCLKKKKKLLTRLVTGYANVPHVAVPPLSPPRYLLSLP